MMTSTYNLDDDDDNDEYDDVDHHQLHADDHPHWQMKRQVLDGIILAHQLRSEVDIN